MTGIIVAVCGGHFYSNASRAFDILDEIHKNRCIIRIIHGGAPGAESLADQWAKENEIDCMRFAAAWKRTGLSAGPARNYRIVNGGGAAMLVAFPGRWLTQDCVRRARKAGLEVIEVEAL